MISNYTQRVAKTVIMNINGSAFQRNEIAAKANERLFQAVSDTFKKEGGVSAAKYKSLLQEIVPGIKLIVKRNTWRANLGMVTFRRSNGIFETVRMHMPIFSKTKKLNEARFSTIMHESRHLFDFVFNPKTIARFNGAPLNDRFVGFASRSKAYGEFYNAKLYADERSAAVLKKLKTTSSVLAVQNRLKNIEKSIKQIFAKPLVSTDEKIELLQGWRYGLMTEKNAYSDGLAYANKRKLSQEMEKSDKIFSDEELRVSFDEKNREEVHKEIVEDRFYDGKIAVIEKVLKAEIAKHRKMHAEELRTKAAATKGEK